MAGRCRHPPQLHPQRLRRSAAQCVDPRVGRDAFRPRVVGGEHLSPVNRSRSVYWSILRHRQPSRSPRSTGGHRQSDSLLQPRLPRVVRAVGLGVFCSRENSAPSARWPPPSQRQRTFAPRSDRVASSLHPGCSRRPDAVRAARAGAISSPDENAIWRLRRSHGFSRTWSCGYYLLSFCAGRRGFTSSGKSPRAACGRIGAPSVVRRRRRGGRRGDLCRFFALPESPAARISAGDRSAKPASIPPTSTLT